MNKWQVYCYQQFFCIFAIVLAVGSKYGLIRSKNMKARKRFWKYNIG